MFSDEKLVAALAASSNELKDAVNENKLYTGCIICMLKEKDCPVDYAIKQKAKGYATMICKPFCTDDNEWEYPRSCIKEWYPHSAYCPSCGWFKHWPAWGVIDGIATCSDCGAEVIC